jgi:hypothetical protein
MTLFLVVLVVLLMIVAFVLWTLYTEARDKNLAYISQLGAMERRLDSARAALLEREAADDAVVTRRDSISAGAPTTGSAIRSRMNVSTIIR